jgi:hypothetical protein
VPPWTRSDAKMEIDVKAKKKPPSDDSEELLRIDEWIA